MGVTTALENFDIKYNKINLITKLIGEGINMYLYTHICFKLSSLLLNTTFCMF